VKRKTIQTLLSWRNRVTPERLRRLIVDALAINVALVGGLILRLFAAVWFADNLNADSKLIHSLVSAYLAAAPVITPLVIGSLILTGVYNRSRKHSRRRKIVLVAQGVTEAYVLYGAVSYLLFDLTTWFPRSVWLTSWLLTVLLLGFLRLSYDFLRATVWEEAQSVGRPAGRKVRNVLVIGGAGYVGSVLTRKLLALGYSVTVMDALVFGGQSLRELHTHPRFSLVKGDLRHVESVIHSLQYVDAVVHLGGLVGDPACDLDEKLTTDINVAANHLVAQAARGLGIERFIFASTCSVYGASKGILSEESDLDPVSLYAKTKMESEAVLLDLQDGRFAPTLLRFGTFFGVSPRPRFDLVVNLLTAKAVVERSITIHGGEQWRPFIHVDDGAEAIIKCLQAPVESVMGETFNVGSDEQNHTIRDIAEMIKGAVPEAEVVVETANGEVPNYRVSCRKISRRIGFSPRHSVQDGIDEIKRVIQDKEIPDYLDDRYSNKKTLSEEVLLDLTKEVNLLSVSQSDRG
jgi:nucleoside-diphosphate-sugar epimerase